MHPSHERRRYSVTPSLIDWAHKQNDLWITLIIQSCCSGPGKSYHFYSVGEETLNDMNRIGRYQIFAK